MQKMVTVGGSDAAAFAPARDLEIDEADPAQPEGRLLLAALDLFLATRCAPERPPGERPDELKAAGDRFFVARLNGQPAACGALRIDGEAAEVKRMYTAEAARGLGVALQVLDALEGAARRAGVWLVRLEAGRWQPEALGLYERAGYRQCAPFGRFLDRPAPILADSLFYEKRL